MCVQANGVWHSANGHNEFVCINTLGFALGIGVGHFDALLAALNVADFHAQFNFQTLFVESLFGFLRNLLVHKAQESGQSFKDGHFRAQAAPYRTHLKANDARANEHQLFRDCAHVQSAVIGQHIDFIKRCAGQCTRIGTCGHNDVLAHQCFVGCTTDCNFIAAFNSLAKSSAAVEKRHFVLFEQVQNAIVVLLYNLVFAGDHLHHIHADAFHLNAVVGKVMVGLIEVFRRLQQSFGRNAPDVGASATKGWAASCVFPLVHTRYLESQLRCANGSNVTTWAATNDDHIKLFAHAFFLRLRCQTTSVMDLLTLLSWPPSPRQLHGHQ